MSETSCQLSCKLQSPSSNAPCIKPLNSRCCNPSPHVPVEIKEEKEEGGGGGGGGLERGGGGGGGERGREGKKQVSRAEMSRLYVSSYQSGYSASFFVVISEHAF